MRERKGEGEESSTMTSFSLLSLDPISSNLALLLLNPKVTAIRENLPEISASVLEIPQSAFGSYAQRMVVQRIRNSDCLMSCVLPCPRVKDRG